jgi:hypothetical protein
VYGGADGAFTLYEDQGLTFDYEKSAGRGLPHRRHARQDRDLQGRSGRRRLFGQILAKNLLILGGRMLVRALIVAPVIAVLAGAGTGCSDSKARSADAGYVDAALVDVRSSSVVANDARVIPPGGSPYTLFMVDDFGAIKICASAVDATHVYWAGNGGELLRRVLDASSPAEKIGLWEGTNCGQQLAVDQDYVYYLDSSQWLRIPKSGGTPESLPLEARGGDVAADEEYAYAALVGCASLARVRHGQSTSEVVYPPNPVTRTPGQTHLLLDHGDIYCSCGQYVFVSRKWGPLEELTSSGLRIFGVTVLDGAVYWTDETPDAQQTMLYRRTADGEITVVSTIPAFHPYRPFADAPRNRILFIDFAGWMFAVSTTDGSVKTVLEQGWSHGAPTRDEKYLYWGRFTDKYASIERVPIDLE